MIRHNSAGPRGVELRAQKCPANPDLYACFKYLRSRGPLENNLIKQNASAVGKLHHFQTTVWSPVRGTMRPFVTAWNTLGPLTCRNFATVLRTARGSTFLHTAGTEDDYRYLRTLFRQTLCYCT